MPDLEKIKFHLISLSEALNNLEKHKGISEKDIKSNLDLLWILERGIYLSIQNLFDIFAHIVSADFRIKWESYSDIAEILFDEKIINEKDKELLIQMAGYRNRLSHDYLSLDLNILETIMDSGLSEIKNFQVVILNYCDL